jgi:hypothetical protein
MTVARLRELLVRRVAVPALAGAVLLACAACSGTLTLHAPDVAAGTAREPTRVDLGPIETRGAVVGSYDAPGPAAVLTAAMNQELAGRALTGGEPGGYAVRCALDRFAVRSAKNPIESIERLALYADLSCEARRNVDDAAVWRGELRGRSCAEGGNVLGTSIGVTQRLVDRALSDAAREMASDLAVRALALRTAPSARAFEDEGEQRARGGLDDSAWGPAVLMENPAVVARALRSLDTHDAASRAAVWNVVAMASGPDEPWGAGESLTLDDDAYVRFEQYKALARRGSPASLAQLRLAVAKEGDELLAEMARDALASGGTGFRRSMRTNASAATNGTATRP